MPARLGLGLMVAAVASLGSACTTVLYKGPARPAAEIAVLTSRDTRIVKVDNVRVGDSFTGNGARYEVLPGEHEVAITLSRTIPGFFSSTLQFSSPIIVCVDLLRGHTYRTEPVIEGQRWVPKVIDVNLRRSIDPACDDEEDDKPIPAAAAQTTPTAASARDGGASAPDANDGLDAGAAPPPVAPAAPKPVAAAVDRDEPRRRPTRSSLAAGNQSSQAQASGRKPGSGISLFMGLAYGGDDFVTASSSNGSSETLSAGTGVILGVGGMVTPLWVSETVGLGAGLDVALKYDGVDAANGSASITRFPLSLTAHLLTNGPGGDHYLMLKGGFIRDYGVSYRLSGVLDSSVEGRWGPMGAIGYYKRSNDSFAWDLMGFFAFTDHVAPGATIDARSVGLTLGFHLNL